MTTKSKVKSLTSLGGQLLLPSTQVPLRRPCPFPFSYLPIIASSRHITSVPPSNVDMSI